MVFASEDYNGGGSFVDRGPTPAQVKQVRDGAVSAGLLPIIKQETDAMERVVITRTLQALQRGELTSEAAIEAWRELAATRRLLKSFQTRVTIGASVAGELGPELDPSNKEQ